MEATNVNFARFQESVAINQFQGITAYKMAVGKEDACMAMAIGWSPKANFGMNQLVTDVSRKTAKSIEPVRVGRLDDIVPRGKQVQFMKMDVEGAECDAVRGARDLFAEGRVERLFVEVNPIALKSHGCSVTGFGNLLKALCMDVSNYKWTPRGAGDFSSRPVTGECQVPPRDELP